MDPAELAKTEAAFAKGYRDADELMTYFQQHPGVPVGVDPKPHPDDWHRRPVGLGYSSPPPPIPVYEADNPGLVPHVLPIPEAFDASAPPSVTGSSHGWGMVPAAPGMVPASSGVAYLGLGEDQPPRRNLFSRLLGRRH